MTESYLFLHARICGSHHWKERERTAVIAWCKANGLDANRIEANTGIAIRSPKQTAATSCVADFVLCFNEYRDPMDGSTVERQAPMLAPLPNPPTFPVDDFQPKSPCPTCGQEVPVA